MSDPKTIGNRATEEAEVSFDEKINLALQHLEIRVEVPTKDRGCWRCEKCSKMQRGLDAHYWVVDGVLIDDPDWSVKERQHRSQWNGHFSAWCRSCIIHLIGKSGAFFNLKENNVGTKDDRK